MATIKDVARLAGVSISTVSKYINGGSVRQENALSIRQAIEELDFHANPFARGLKTQTNRSIGILLPDMTAPFYGAVTTTIDRILRENGYHTLFSCYGANHGLERENLQFLLSTGISGLIYVPEDLSADEFHELTCNLGIPTVQMDRIIQGVDTDAVLSDNVDAAYQGVTRLIQRGHTRIAAITGPKSVFSSRERLVGYLRALSDNNILYDDELVINGEYTFANGYRGFEALMALPAPPTAVFTSNYDITLGLITAARERGFHIPEQIDIVGFDCADVCAIMRPPLPVMQQQEQLIGQMTAEYILQRLSGYSGPPRITRLPCKMTP